MNKIKYRKYSPLPIDTHPLIEGRVASPWLYRNMHAITHEDFYNKSLAEEDLKKKYPELT
jgi:hypothetical protein